MNKFLVIITCMSLVLSMLGCKNNNDTLNSSFENSMIDNNANSKTLKDFFIEDSSFSFQDVCAIEIVNTNHQYYEIKNTYFEYLNDIVEYIDKCEVVPTEKSNDKTDQYYIVLSNETEILSFYLFSDDTTFIRDKNNNQLYLYKEGLYKEFENLLLPIVEKCDQFYKVEYLPGQFKYKHEIFTNNGDTIVSDTFPKEPHISLRENNVVCMWTQAGTGSLVRGTDFYNTNTGEKSPHYGGIVDSYNNLVLNSESKSVIISDMFSGNILQIIDKFKMNPYDAIETIIDARFIENATKVSITYLAEDSSEQTEIFDVVLSSEKDLPEWKKAYLDFLDDKDGEYLSFALVYIDGDDIPELYMSGCCEATGDSISSFKKGKIVEQLLNRIGGGKYIRKDGKIYNCNGNMGYYRTHVYELNSNGFNQLIEALSVERYKQINDYDVEITYEYSVEDKLVSKEEYDATINAVFNIDNSIRLNKNVVSYDAIRQQILEF